MRIVMRGNGGYAGNLPGAPGSIRVSERPTADGRRAPSHCSGVGWKRASQILSSRRRLSPNRSSRTPIRSISDRYRLQARRLSSPSLK